MRTTRSAPTWSADALSRAPIGPRRPFIVGSESGDRRATITAAPLQRRFAVGEAAARIAAAQCCLSERSRAKALRAAVADFRTTSVPNLPAVAVERFGRSAQALESEWLE